MMMSCLFTAGYEDLVLSFMVGNLSLYTSSMMGVLIKWGIARLSKLYYVREVM